MQHTLTCFKIPLTNPYPGPRSCIIVDNCSIHHAEEIRQLVEDEAGMVFSPLSQSILV